MVMRWLSVPLGLLLLLPVHAMQPASRADSVEALFAALQSLRGDLPRYRYLSEALPSMPPQVQPAALQLLASVEAELGLYTEALTHFPHDNRDILEQPLPDPAQWRSADALEQIVAMAAARRVVLINEAHHDASTRLLTLQLLPRLRQLGFTHVAFEALDRRDGELQRRGYPVTDSGSEYLHEPIYGELVRQAVALGFQVVAYESEQRDTSQRENEQAAVLARLLHEQPQARLLVHAGYAHIDKSIGRLGPALPMAGVLARLSGTEPLSIEQTQWRPIPPSYERSAYPALIALYQPSYPIVLLNRLDGRPWSQYPQRYDLQVILPPWTLRDGRPTWLSLQGSRLPQWISNRACRQRWPCLIEARYATESDQAIAADRQVLSSTDTHALLYLYPGTYRLRFSDAYGRVLSERDLQVRAGRR